MSNRYHALAVLLTMLSGCTSTGAPATNLIDQGSDASRAPQQVLVPPGEQGLSETQHVDAGVLYDMGMTAKASGNYPVMLDSLLASADAGHALAHYELARLLTEGEIVVADSQAARMYLERSAELGNPEAMRVMAWNALRGDGVARDTDQGVSMMRAAAQTSTRAQRELGMLYANIYEPHLNDIDQGSNYLTMAAESGDAEAAYQLGRLKESSGDAIGAVEWYERANVAGQVKASAALKALMNGEPPAAPLAIQSTQQQASMSRPMRPEAMYQRAMQLLSNRQSAENEADAYALLVLSSEGGYAPATQELGLQGGVKYQLDQRNPAWLEQAKQRVMAGH